MKRSKPQTCRLRKVQCEECGYVVRVTRAWLLEGLPECPNHGPMMPTEPCDLAYIGLIGPGDMPARDWTAICRENGWDDAILRPQGTTARYGYKAPAMKAVKATCGYVGCGRWIAAGDEFCHEHSSADALEAMPF